jgi:hypothetical protein
MPNEPIGYNGNKVVLMSRNMLYNNNVYNNTAEAMIQDSKVFDEDYDDTTE